MDIAKIVNSQYMATLDMLEEAIEKCPESLWYATELGNPFFQIAYHALVYCHLYVQPTEADFVPWEKHIQFHSSFGEAAYPGAPTPEPGKPYTKADIAEYMQVCREEVRRIVPILDWEAESGFHWLQFGKLELQFYSIRHIQGHAGELAERLNSLHGIEVSWVGRGSIDE